MGDVLLRNRELRTLALVWTLLTVALAVGAGALVGGGAACCVITTSFVLAFPVALETGARYRAIARLTADLDEILHGRRNLNIDHMSEGELAILASELDKMVSRLNLTADELAQETQRLADALADISHQLKTPLTSLSITTELVRRHLSERGDCAEEVERLGVIERLELHIEQLVSTLLKLARLDAGAVRFACRGVEVAKLVAVAFEPLAIAYDIADVHFECDVAGGTVFRGDAAWSAEALSNILKNCLEHTPAGGAVRLRAWEDTLGTRIVIEDTGPGFDADDLPHVFERFFRGRTELRRERDQDRTPVDPSGVGIGLSLAKSLITAQDGTIAARNALDATGRPCGARFEITFFKSVV